MSSGRTIIKHLRLASRRSLFPSFVADTLTTNNPTTNEVAALQIPRFQHSLSGDSLGFSRRLSHQFLSTSAAKQKKKKKSDYDRKEKDEDQLIPYSAKNQLGITGCLEEDDDGAGWEEEEEPDPFLGDGGVGGGVVLQGVPWGNRVLSLAQEVLLQFPDDLKLYAFKATCRGYVFVTLDKLSDRYGSPSMEELHNYSREYKNSLDELGILGEIPHLSLGVSSPGVERILKVPDDLSRFKEVAMKVRYLEDKESPGQEKYGVFFLESIETESGCCVWKLADAKENRDPKSKGRPLSRKMREWHLKLPFEMHRRVTLYPDCRVYY